MESPSAWATADARMQAVNTSLDMWNPADDLWGNAKNDYDAVHPVYTCSSHKSAHLQAASNRTVHPHGTVTEQHLHAYERQRSKTVTAIRTSVPPADAGTRRVESASERRACKREKCNVRLISPSSTVAPPRHAPTWSPVASDSNGATAARIGELRNPRAPTTPGSATTPATYQQATAALYGRRFAEERFTSDDVQVQKIDYPPNATEVTAGAAAGQWSHRCSRHRRFSSRATDAKVRCTTRCIPNESKNRKVHGQERRSPAHSTQTRIVASSSTMPVQEWSLRQAQHQYKN